MKSSVEHTEGPGRFYEAAFTSNDYPDRDLSEHEMRIRSIMDKYVPASAAVLEVGSGRGQLSHLSQRYIALDLSLTALKRFIDGPAVCASAEELPFADISFGIVITIATLEHVQRPERAFAELDRVLAPGGVLYLAPAWHVRPWVAEGLPVRPWKGLSMRQKVTKLLIPVLNSTVWRGLVRIPWRIARRAEWRLVLKRPVSLKYRRLNPNYVTYWMSDSDAACSLDSHEGILYFESRGYQCLSHTNIFRRLFARGDAVVVQKPDRT